MITVTDNNGTKHCFDMKHDQVSDGYHTFGEIYEHRYYLWIATIHALAHVLPDGMVWKSKLHHDGTMFKDSFILGAGVAKGEQITYHLPLKYWDVVKGAKELERAYEYDGHKPQDVLDRIKEHLIDGCVYLRKEESDIPQHVKDAISSIFESQGINVDPDSIEHVGTIRISEEEDKSSVN